MSFNESSPSSRPLTIGIIGAGAIGVYVGSCIQLFSKPTKTTVKYVGRSQNLINSMDSITSSHSDSGSSTNTIGFKIQSGVDNINGVIEKSNFNYSTDIKSIIDSDVVIVAVKSGETAAVGESIASALPFRKFGSGEGPIIFSFQNGVQNATILRKILPRLPVSPAVVTFNVVWNGNEFRRTSSGPLIIQIPSLYTNELNASPSILSLFHQTINVLRQSGFQVQVNKSKNEMIADQHAKLITNLINGVTALSGIPTLATLQDRRYRCVWSACVFEAYNVFKAANIPLGRIFGVPIPLFGFALCLPDSLFWFISRKLAKLDPTARSSMLADLDKRKDKTEVRMLNGHIIQVYQDLKAQNPEAVPQLSVSVNQKIIELIEEAEVKQNGSPQIPADKLVQLLNVNTDLFSANTKKVLTLSFFSILFLISFYLFRN